MERSKTQQLLAAVATAAAAPEVLLAVETTTFALQITAKFGGKIEGKTVRKENVPAAVAGNLHVLRVQICVKAFLHEVWWQRIFDRENILKICIIKA